MNAWVAKARAFAEEAAKKSQELASQTAKYSEQLAKEAAQKSKELAEKSRVLANEAAKKADLGYKALVKDFNATTLSVQQPKAPSEAELEEYGITTEFREFIKGLTIKTFRDFPADEVDNAKESEAAVAEAEEAKKASPQIAKDLSDWQERHATLVLQVVPEISDFRYVLCPRRMTERRFWRIYFVLVRTHIAPYETRGVEKAAKLKAEEELAVAEANKKLKEQELSTSAQCPEGSSVSAQPSSSGIPTAGPAAAAAASASAAASGTETSGGKKDEKVVDSEQELDAYLMGALGDEGPGDDDDDVGDFDPEDFDQFVNDGALDSPVGEEPGKAGGSKSGAHSDPSSDGELVEAPSTEPDMGGKRP